MPRGLFVEPFYGGSHRAFLEGLVKHSSHEIEVLSLPEGEWRRRMRMGAQELAGMSETVEGEFDFLVVSDMLDLPVFLALTRPRFAATPVLAYFHENQFTYPRIRGTKFNSWFGQINYLTALAADRVAFNSEFHRQDFLRALRTLDTQPNNWLATDAIAEIEAKSGVLPVGVELAWLDEFGPRGEHRTPMLLWNHRWEFDKAPEMFERGLTQLADEGLPFEVIIAGEPGDNPSAAMHRLRGAIGGRVRHFGYAESRGAYGRLLWQSDIAVSTTRHEFFGVGMVEAMYAGCIPCAPNRYNYPALVPEALHERCLFENEQEFVTKLRELIATPLNQREAVRTAAARYAWANVIGQWDESLQALARVGRSRAHMERRP
jgi:glycosyltransferase involved in cell wall biosynthesis